MAGLVGDDGNWWVSHQDDYWGPRSVVCGSGGGVGCDGTTDNGDPCRCACHGRHAPAFASNDEVTAWHTDVPTPPN